MPDQPLPTGGPYDAEASLASPEGFTEGRCAACNGAAEMGPSGAWWHLDPYSCGRPDPHFRAGRGS